MSLLYPGASSLPTQMMKDFTKTLPVLPKRTDRPGEADDLSWGPRHVWWENRNQTAQEQGKTWGQNTRDTKDLSSLNVSVLLTLFLPSGFSVALHSAALKTLRFCL